MSHYVPQSGKQWTLFYKDRKMAQFRSENWIEAIALAKTLKPKDKSDHDWEVMSSGGRRWPLVHTPEMVNAIKVYVVEKFHEDLDRDLSLPEEEQKRLVKELTKKIQDGEIL